MVKQVDVNCCNADIVSMPQSMIKKSKSVSKIKDTKKKINTEEEFENDITYLQRKYDIHMKSQLYDKSCHCELRDASMFYSTCCAENEIRVDRFFEHVNRTRKSFGFLYNLNTRKGLFDSFGYFDVMTSVRLIQKLGILNNMNHFSLVNGLISLLQNQSTRMILKGSATMAKRIIKDLVIDACLEDTITDPLRVNSGIVCITHDDVPQYILTPTLSIISGDVDTTNIICPVFSFDQELTNGLCLSKRLNPMLFQYFINEHELAFMNM